jgi:hypothetical protein
MFRSHDHLHEEIYTSEINLTGKFSAKFDNVIATETLDISAIFWFYRNKNALGLHLICKNMM